MASSFAAQRTEKVDALFAQVVERVIGVQAGEENLAIAHNYCLYHTRHHSFPDPDPQAVRDEVDALRERLGIHAQLEKQRALEMLVGRFEETPWPDVDVPDVHARVMLLLLRLSGNPLHTKYSHVDAARAVGDGNVFSSARDAGLTMRAREHDEESTVLDDATESEDDARSIDSESTLSDWSDDEETVSRRAEAVAARVAAAARAARNAKENERPPDATNDPNDPSDPNANKNAPSSGFSWRALGNALVAAEDSAAEANDEKTRTADATQGSTKNTKFVSSAPPPPKRNGAGETVVVSASRLFPALIAARGDDLATNALAGAAERVARGEGRETLASAVAASRRRRTEASAVGAALHAMHGVAPADGSSGPASVPHLSPCALEAALSGAREAAASLDATRRLARATLDPNASSGPTLRAAAAATSRVEQEIRDALAPLLLRAAGLQAASTRGAPTLLELRASMRVVSARSRALRALADAALASPPPEHGHAASPARAASRCLDALRTAAATRQTSASDDGCGFVDAARLFCAAAQPYLAALHRWLDSGALEDPAGELFVRRGPGVAEPPGTEAHWHAGYAVRRGRLGEPECPEFLRRFAEELLEAGKTAGLLRARGPGEGVEAKRRKGEKRRKDKKQGRDEDEDEDETTFGSALPPWRRHLGVSFCLGARAALEGASVAAEARRSEKIAFLSRDASRDESRASALAVPETRGAYDPEDDESHALVAPLAPLARAVRVDGERRDPPRDAGGLDPFAGAGIAPLLEEAAATTRLAAFSGGTGATADAFSSSCPFSAAAALDAWLRDAPAARAPATTPFAAVVAAAAVAPARHRARRLSRALMARLRGAWGLGAYLAALRATYLGGAGEATSAFARVAHARLAAAEAAAEGDPGSARARAEEALDRAELESALAEAMSLDASGTLPDPATVSLEVLPEALPEHGVVDQQPWSSLDALARVRVRVEAPWPLALVVPARSAEAYGAASAFLAQLRFSRAAAEAHATRAWTASSRRQPGGCGGGATARLLAAETRHFVSALHEHVSSRVLETSWGEFQKKLARAESLEAAREAHASFLDAACRQCLASPDPTWTLLARQVKAALAAVCDLAAAGRRADRDAETSASAAAGAVSEAEAEHIASRFRRARSYILRVVDSKLKIGSFPELAELRSRLDFNGFYGAKDPGEE
jgi:gamma-tubulin complex component 5